MPIVEGLTTQIWGHNPYIADPSLSLPVRFQL